MKVQALETERKRTTRDCSVTRPLRFTFTYKAKPAVFFLLGKTRDETILYR